MKVMTRRFLAGLALLALGGAPALARPIEVRVVVVTTWEDMAGGRDARGELHAWLTRWPMTSSLPFAVGARALAYDRKRHVLAVLTGMATARAAASVIALGEDPRFDLRHAYWVVAGTAGVDPKVASAGSIAWARYVIDGDLNQELDVRDMPSDWPDGVVPYERIRPYESPRPATQNDFADVGFTLNRRLVDWAYAATQGVTLADDETLRRLREPYAEAARRPPFVLEGDTLASARSWYGDHATEWARRWVDYWTAGQGVFTMSDEEDSGMMEALTMLARDHKVRLDRVLILRGASDYTLNPPGMSAGAFLAKETHEGFPAEQEALDNLYAVAAPVVHALADDWARTRAVTPGG